jgi:predicted transcriptional regulator
VIKDMRKFEDLTKSDFQVPSSIDDNKALLKKIVERLLKQDKARLIEIVRNLNAKYEYAHLAQYLMRVILPDFDAPLYVEHFKKL